MRPPAPPGPWSSRGRATGCGRRRGGSPSSPSHDRTPPGACPSRQAPCTEQHDADAYGQELARISHHQHEAIEARFTVFQALPAVGIGHEQADDLASKLEAGAVVGAHT
ncbi:hypothetical protein ACWDY4_46390 [Streptomyces olivaceoviridis]